MGRIATETNRRVSQVKDGLHASIDGNNGGVSEETYKRLCRNLKLKADFRGEEYHEPQREGMTEGSAKAWLTALGKKNDFSQHRPS